MTEPSKLTPQQVWAARLLVGWSRDRLASRSGTTIAFVWMYEIEGRLTKMYSREQSLDGLVAIRSTLEAAGVEFTEENGGKPGVRWS
ncbi:MAG: transcriptional regulator [Oxalobacteraceae bacterium]|nr:MAG: transcriptional regulator [Oxalobacteraceae bacterium]